MKIGKPIYQCALRGLNLTDTAKFINADISTVKKEIDRNKELKMYVIYKNTCGKKAICNLYNICGNSKCSHKCSNCLKDSCNKFCCDYVKEPVCKYLKKHCGVCNGCKFVKECKLNKWFYDPLKSQSRHKTNLSDAHKGCRLSYSEVLRLSEFIKPFLNKNISIETIKSQYPDKIPYSIQSIYDWINLGYLPNINNLDLLRKVRYTKRNIKKDITYDKNYLNNRYYEDFIRYITDNPYDEVVEMDTVEGKNKQSFILTLLFRKSNFMLAFKLKDHTSSSVIAVFNLIKDKLGAEIFKQAFKIILTDRGSEFSLPEAIEIDNCTGEVLTRVFYCNSRQSQQKGKIEKNHEELRKIFPKGFDFNLINQNDLNLALNHINSLPRKIFNFNTPYKLFKSYAPLDVLDLNNSTSISFNALNLSPSLIKK